MSRIASKGWLRVEKAGNTNCFSATIGQKAVLSEETSRFFDKVVGEEPANLELVLQAAEPKVQRVS